MPQEKRRGASRLFSVLRTLANPAVPLAVVVMLPLLMLVVTALSASSPIFAHLRRTVLWDYVQNSLLLVVGVCVMTLF